MARKSKLQNMGLHADRFGREPEERRFAEAWDAINRRLGVVQVRTLEAMLGDGLRPAEVTARERQVAATVIQWLGSPIGQEWLRQLGYERKA